MTTTVCAVELHCLNGDTSFLLGFFIFLLLTGGGNSCFLCD